MSINSPKYSFWHWYTHTYVKNSQARIGIDNVKLVLYSPQKKTHCSHATGCCETSLVARQTCFFQEEETSIIHTQTCAPSHALCSLLPITPHIHTVTAGAVLLSWTHACVGQEPPLATSKTSGAVTPDDKKQGTQARNCVYSPSAYGTLSVSMYTWFA